MNNLDGNDDLFDSREVVGRIAELESIPVIDREPEEQDELDHLAAFAVEAAEYCPDWQYGETFISDDYFVQYAQDFAEDIGAIDRNAAWPFSYIDWEAAAAALLMDYQEFDLGGTKYWARA